MPTLQSRAKLLDRVRSHAAPDRVKRAAIGGDPESSFEQSFASLAFSFLQDKAPGLLDYLIGFQLVDRNDDNTKAVGIFGFQLDKQWLYAPVFFLAGELKGHELLYLKNQDSFVPLKENWINYILAKKPSILGEGTSESLRQLGAQTPDLRSTVYPPYTSKFSSYREPPRLHSWAKDVMPQLAGWATQHPFKLEKFAALDSRCDLRSFLASDIKLAASAVSLCEQYPSIKAAMDSFYGKNMLADVLKEMHKAASVKPSLFNREVEQLQKAPQHSFIFKSAVAETPAKVKVDTDETITPNDKLTEENKSKLMEDGYLVRDYRKGEEVSVAYQTQIDVTLSNPDDTDVYDLLVKPGDFERCLVVLNPHGNDGHAKFAVVVRLDGEKNWLNCYPEGLFVRHGSKSLSQRETYKKWFDGLPDSKDLEKGATYVLVSERGQGSITFEVRDKEDDGAYSVYFNSYCHEPAGVLLGNRQRQHWGSNNGPWDYVANDNPMVIFNQRESTTFKSLDKNLYAPKSCKAIKIKDPPKRDKDKDGPCCFSVSSSGSDKSPIRPGNLVDIQTQVLQKTAELRIWTDHHEVVINQKRMPKLAGLFHLIRDHGFRELTAKELLKQADCFDGARFRVKYADDVDPTMFPGPGAPAFPEAEYGSYGGYGNAQQIMPQTSYQAVPELDPTRNQRQVYDPQQDYDPNPLQVAQQAQQTGQKEVFDTAMIGTMLKSVRDDSLVDKHLGDLLKALDRLGRLLFMFYWHNENFMERFGKQDLPELEDTLRNAFEVLGDLILFLKQKTIEPSSGDMLGAPDINSAAKN